MSKRRSRDSVQSSEKWQFSAGIGHHMPCYLVMSFISTCIGMWADWDINTPERWCVNRLTSLFTDDTSMLPYLLSGRSWWFCGKIYVEKIGIACEKLSHNVFGDTDASIFADNDFSVAMERYQTANSIQTTGLWIQQLMSFRCLTWIFLKLLVVSR